MNGHLADIAKALTTLASTLDHYRPQIDKAAKLADNPVVRRVGKLTGRV
jgi:hypothetical protein